MSNQLYQLECEQNTLSISGEITVHTVLDMQKSITAIERFSIIDLSDVDKTDSAGLALLVNWISQDKSDCRLTVKNAPTALRALSKLAGVSYLFE